MGRAEQLKKIRKIEQKEGESKKIKKAENRHRLFLVLALILIIAASSWLKNIIGTNSNVNQAQNENQSGDILAEKQSQKNPIATISTNLGEMEFELFGQEAPKTVENFIGLAQKGYYNRLLFHRVIKDFMIQAGDPFCSDEDEKTACGSGGQSIWGNNFEDEINPHKIIQGALAMANSGPNTNSSQFFIVTEKPQPHLDGKHTVFGQLLNGAPVLQAIAGVPVDENDQPKQEIYIHGIQIKE